MNMGFSQLLWDLRWSQRVHGHQGTLLGWHMPPMAQQGLQYCVFASWQRMGILVHFTSRKWILNSQSQSQFSLPMLELSHCRNLCGSCRTVAAVATYVGAVALSQLSQAMLELSHCRTVVAFATYVGAVALSHCRNLCWSCRTVAAVAT